jgi:GNAT superfamily N-acetyltransferase
MTPSTDPPIHVTAGADTHRDTHMIAALDQRGAKLGVREFATDPTGHDDILDWLESFGTIDRIGVEGTGTYGAGLCRFLQRHEVVGYCLFWYDPVTEVGFVEPMGVDENQRRRGLAQHILTAGIDKLATAGATRLKINFENDNPASATLYPGSGFEPAMTTSLYVLTTD